VQSKLCKNGVPVTSSVARGKWGMRPEAQALGAHQHTFCSHSKMRFKQKFRLNYALKCVFLEKSWKNCLSIGSSAPNPSFASGGWGLHSQTPMLSHPPTITTLSNSFLMHPQRKITEVNVCFCFISTFAPIFRFKLCSFCWRGCKNISCPRTQGTLAIPLPVSDCFPVYNWWSVAR